MKTLFTERLILRPFSEVDGPLLIDIVNDKNIANTMISIPHPYTLEYFQEWLKKIKLEIKNSKAVHYAITQRSDGKLIGSTELRDIDPEHLQAELSLWIGQNWWNNGYAAEAARAVIELGFRNLGLNRIYAHHMIRNKSCEGLFKKIGMSREGILRQRVIKWGVFEDVGLYAIIKSDFEKIPSLPWSRACENRRLA